MRSADLSPREYHDQRERELRAERERLRLEVLERVKAAIRKRAPEFPAVKTVYLFGSLVQPGRFRPGSDVDLAVDCDDIQVETPFWRALEQELERDVDLRPREGPVAQAVEDQGERVYEREAPDPGA